MYSYDLRMIQAWNEERKSGLEQSELVGSRAESEAVLKAHPPAGVKDKALYQVGRLLVNWGGSLIYSASQ